MELGVSWLLVMITSVWPVDWVIVPAVAALEVASGEVVARPRTAEDVATLIFPAVSFLVSISSALIRPAVREPVTVTLPLMAILPSAVRTRRLFKILMFPKPLG